jgi:CDGSH-type Zn-finger protein
VEKTKITAKPGGPYMVEGPITLIGPDGQEVEVKGNKTWLCRCGGSANKPFCDGTHSKIGFAAAEAARDAFDAEQAARKEESTVR